MVNRKRNLRLAIWLTKEEKELLKKVSTIKGLTMTDLIVNLVKEKKSEMEEPNNEA